MLRTLLNRLALAKGYFLGTPLRETYPQEIVLELTSFCNLKCKMCPQSGMQRQRGFMSADMFRKVIDEVRGKTELIYLHGTGESLLHKDLQSCIAYANQNGLKTCLSTNGQLLDAERARSLLDSGLTFLIIAFDGGKAETYENIRIGGDFSTLIENTKGVLRLKREMQSKTHVTLQMIYMPENREETDLLLGNFTRREIDTVDQFRFKPLYETYALQKEPIPHTRPCYWLWNMLFVCWDGRVGLCCMDAECSWHLGDLRGQSVKDVWNGELFNQLRNRHKRLELGRMHLCDCCDIPEQGYFKPSTILASALVPAGLVRRLIPVYERWALGVGRGG